MTISLRYLRYNYSSVFTNSIQLGVKGSSAAQLIGACRVADLLAPAFKKDLLQWFLKLQLSEYTVLFAENQDVW